MLEIYFESEGYLFGWENGNAEKWKHYQALERLYHGRASFL
jgi:hypothetical protein